ncbi:MAG: cytochrome c biogenesis CcdA family protein [Anaerolineaceae bacterium]|jgi:cytochrome c-type biogenesis protein
MDSNRKFPIQISRRNIIFGSVILIAVALLVTALLAGDASAQRETSMLALIPAAFLSGLLSFLSPCSLPILPAYFAYSFQSSRKNVVLMTLAFFMGLATTMTILGASVSAIGSVLVRNISAITTIGGLLIILFGVLSILGKGFTGIQFQDRPASTIAGSFIYGATFAIGWTACIGPILGAILTLLANQGAGVLQGAILSFIYAMGLGLPLILVATFFSRLGNGSRFWRFIRGRGISVKLGSLSLDLHTTGIISGVLMIAIGVLLATGQLTQITQLALNSNISIWVVEMDENLRAFFGIR